MSQSVSALGPIDPSTIPDAENEKHASWIVRKLVGSMTGRIVVSSYETLRSAGTSVICLSPWGDSSPLLLPCIRFRDLAIHVAIVATGGAATVAAPVMGPVSDIIVGHFGDTIIVELAEIAGYEATVRLGDALIDHSISHSIPIHSKVLETTTVKELTITLKFKHTTEDATLGYFRSSLHAEKSLFSSVTDYLAIEKGWFSPYLFASSRRPTIPRTMTPDIIFCHGPFLQGDYRVGETLLAQSANSVLFCSGPAIAEPEAPSPPAEKPSSSLHLPTLSSLSKAGDMFARSRTPSPEPQLTALPPPPKPRRMLLAVVGLKPHRKLWTTSARPGESVVRYQLLNGCPAVVVPVQVGAPLLAWMGTTLEQLWKVPLPKEEREGEMDLGKEIEEGKWTFENVVAVVWEFLGLCVDWPRVEVPGKEGQETGEEERKTVVREAVALLVAGAIRSGESKAVKKDVDKERSGIAMWRIP